VPEAPERYHQKTIDGIQVSVSKEAAVGASHIKFQLRGLWFLKRITVSGIQFPRI